MESMETRCGNIKKIYNALNDDISRTIFVNRLNYYMIGDLTYVRKIPRECRTLNAGIIKFANVLYNENKKNLVIFGAGANGIDLAANLNDLPFVGFVDNYKKKDVDERTKLPIYSFEEYKELYGLDKTRFVIAVSRIDFAEAIQNQLRANGVAEEDIVYIKDWRNNTSQYFDLFVPHEHERFVDCGCYDGSTAFRFAGWCAEGGMTYDKIWSFEPDAASYEKCKNILQKLPDCELFPYGLSDQHTKVSFMANGCENARIVENETVSGNGIQQIEVVKLDELLDGEKVTFIKMDIEGAEYAALKGAEKIIREQRPRLAISIYHKPSDIVEIPKLLLEYRDDYKFYLRHYSLIGNETVLYAE